MHFLRQVVFAIIALLLLVAVSGCDKEGPAERAGKKIDETIEESGKKLDDLGK